MRQALRRGVLAALVCAGAAPAFQSALPRELLLLNRVKRLMRENLARTPNYTCLQTTERFERPPRARQFRRMDTLRLEVAQVGATELYSWPGAPEFEEKGLSAFAAGGLTSTGAFALHARGVFGGEAPTFRYAGELIFKGRPALQWDFAISYIHSGLRIHAAGASATVACHGSFWVERDSLDLLRLEVIADDIPPQVRMGEAVTRIDYARVQIGGSEILLPQSAELVSVDYLGAARRNRMEFTHCRQYGTESSVSFTVPAEEHDAEQPGRADGATELPPGLQIPMVLETEITGESAVGERITARVEAGIQEKSRLVVPAGALVSGRIRRLEAYREPEPFFVVGLEFTAVEFDGTRARFFAELRDIGPLEGLQRVLKFSRNRENPHAGFRVGHSGMENVLTPDIPGVGTVFLKGADFRLPPGLRMAWRTGRLGN